MNKAKQHIFQLSESFPGQKYYKWLLDNGKEFKASKVNKEIKEQIKRMGRRFKIKQCYYNSQVISMMTVGKFKCYEGYATNLKTHEIFPFEHGWNVINGKVVDVTWDDGVDYFGVEIPLNIIRENWTKTGNAEMMIIEYFRRSF